MEATGQPPDDGNGRAELCSRVLVVDDDLAVLRIMQRALTGAGFAVTAVDSGERAIAMLGDAPWDVIVTDLRMPVRDGLDVLRAAKAFDPHIEVILVSAYLDVAAAVEGTREGGYDFLTKPFSHVDQLTTTVHRAAEKRQMERELSSLRERVTGRAEFSGMIGQSLAMQQLYQRIEQAAPTESTVLIVGETGTGKELVAAAIHERSRRKNGPFVVVNCGALPSGLLESELYGHVKGAFTGAVGAKIGMFEAANGGTLVLDEINSMELASQAALLRALESGEVRPVGSPTAKHVNVRVVASTNRPLQQAMAAGVLREDLFYRLSAVTMWLPPLRERGEDLPLLCDHFLNQIADNANRPAPRIVPEIMLRLQQYAWPGNVRELAHALEQAVIFGRGPLLGMDAFPFLQGMSAPTAPPAYTTTTAPTSFETLADHERHYIEHVLEHTKHNKARAARILGLPRTSLYKRMERLGIHDRG